MVRLYSEPSPAARCRRPQRVYFKRCSKLVEHCLDEIFVCVCTEINVILIDKGLSCGSVGGGTLFATGVFNRFLDPALGCEPERRHHCDV